MEILRNMALFVEVVKARSFSKAAANLGMSPSSLSRHVSELETAVGLSLLKRSTRRIEVSEAGRLYFSRCSDLVDEARLAHEQLQGILTVPKGHLRISSTPDFFVQILAPVLAEFRRLHPQITFDLDLTPRHVDLVAENFDLALRIGKLRDSTIVARRLATLRLALYASPSYLQRHGVPRKPQDLTVHDCIRVLPGPANAVWTLSDGKRSERVVLTSPITVNNIGAIHRLVELGMGIGVVDEAMALSDLEAGRLVRVLPAWSLPGVPIHLLMVSRLLPARTRVFVEFLVERMARSVRS